MARLGHQAGNLCHVIDGFDRHPRARYLMSGLLLHNPYKYTARARTADLFPII